jgi:LytS/YehU family sensor histidine kinase
MTKSLGFTETELLTILHALDTVMQVSVAAGFREDYNDARDVALKLSAYARDELERQDIEEAMAQKQRSTAQ